MIMMSDVVRPSERIVARTVGAETVIVGEKGDALHTLNESGTLIWSLLDGARSLGAVLDALRGEYDVPADRAEADLRGFVEELAAKGIVTVGP